MNWFNGLHADNDYKQRQTLTGWITDRSATRNAAASKISLAFNLDRETF